MVGNRIRTLHGVPIPPRKKKPGRSPGCKFFTLDFVITGAIPSKKNKQIASINRLQERKILRDLASGKLTLQEALKLSDENKPYIRHPPKFHEWETATMELIIGQASMWIDRLRKKGHDLYYPISDASVAIYHYWKDNFIRDNSGKAETIHDLFVKAGILLDDSWQALTPNSTDANCYDGEITDHITTITITGYNW